MLSNKSLPLVTFALITYNQRDYVRDAVRGALLQEYENLEILISDDCSNDGTYEIIKEELSEYNGVHRVKLCQNKKNLGLAQNFNKVIYEASGEILVLGAGDDISLPTRVLDTVAGFNLSENICAVALNNIVINSSGETIHPGHDYSGNIRCWDISSYLSNKMPHPSGAARGYKAEALKLFGGLNKDCPTEDTTSLLRCLIAGRVVTFDKPGIYYRVHNSNVSGAANLSRISYSELFIQYKCDVEMAIKLNLISRKLGFLIIIHCAVRILFRLFRRNILNLRAVVC